MRPVRIPRATGCSGARQSGEHHTATHSDRRRGEHAAQAAGIDLTVMRDVLGDLAEERSTRMAYEGAPAATWWYVHELARSAPHVALGVMRHALSTPRGRWVILGCMAVASSVCVAVFVGVASRGTPAQLSFGQNDTVVVNNERPARIPVHVLDDQGRLLDADAHGVTFGGISAGGITVSRDGEVTCRHAGTARVTAARGGLSRQFVVQCAPLHALAFVAAEQFLVAGGPAEPFAIRGVAPDSAPVARIVGTVTVDDSDIVSIDGSRLRPHRAGSTRLRMAIGDRYDTERLTVHEAAISPARIAIDQVYSGTVSVAPGTELRWPIEHGLYTIWLRPPEGEHDSALHLMLQDFNCDRMFSQQRFCVALAGAVLRVIAPTRTGSHEPFVGRLVVMRHRN